MHHIIYLSWATAPFTEKELRQLLTYSHHRNTQLAVTGILLYGNEQFLQVLEGEEEVVQEVYARIRRDARHSNVLTFANKAIGERTFTDWAMAFQLVSAQQLEKVVGYLGAPTAPVNTTGLSYADRHLFDLLRSFVLP
jgi:uncharacterized protein YaaQ